MTREEFKSHIDKLSMHLTYPELDHLHAINESDAEQRAEIARLREDLKKLVNEIDGLLGIEEEQLRNIVGNTNINVLHVRIARAKQALKETI
jgi:uncharacterized coiled-coil protein SlyX